MVSDHRAFELGRLAFMALGSLNAVLTAAVARRARLGGPAAAVVAGVLYAVWPPAIDAESTTLLTPLNTLGLLVALLLLYRRTARPPEEFLAGVALGAAAAVKIWGVVPLVVVLGWELVRRRGGAAARVALGAAAGVAVVCLPFFLAAPGAMFRMVVLDQLERGEANAGARRRLSGILGLERFGGGARPPSWLLVAAAVLLCALVVAGALLDRAWLVAALLAAIVTLLMVAPSFFAHYPAYAAAPLLILAGTGSAGAGGAGRSRRAQDGRDLRPAWRPGRRPRYRDRPDHRVRLRRRGAPARHPLPRRGTGACSGLESLRHRRFPGALIQMDLLGRDLERGCRVWVDVTGLTYDSAAVRRPNGARYPAHWTRPWQQALLGYLLSGNATILVRRASDGLAPSTASTIKHLPVLARHSGQTLFRVPSVR